MPRGIWRAEEAEFLRESERGLKTAARGELAEWMVERIQPDLFFTGTYDRRRIGRSGAPPGVGPQAAMPRAVNRLTLEPGGAPLPKVSTWKAQRDGRRVFREWSRELLRPVRGALFTEPHLLDGSTHLHGLLNVSGLRMGDIKGLSRVWFGRYGFCRLEVPRSSQDVCLYCGKYVVKDDGEVVLSAGLERDLRLERRFGR